MIIKNTLQTALLSGSGCPYTLILPTIFHKTLYWLHGFQERASDILFKSNLEELAEKYQIAVVIPDLPDTYYLDQPWNKCYTEQFFFQEFLPYAQEKYTLPTNRESSYILGISMGGFGSLLYGSHHPELFSKIISISGAFIIDDLLIGNPEVVGLFDGNSSYFQNLFGDLPSLEEDDKRNPKAAATQTLNKINTSFPEIIIACAQKDLLYSRNVKLQNHLLSVGANVRWQKSEKETSGEHNWLYFHTVLEPIFQKL